MLTAVGDGSWREFDIRLVYDQVWGKTGVCDVRIPIFTVLGLDDEEGKSKQEKRDNLEEWNFTTMLEDLDFADDIALLSSKFNDLLETIGGSRN